MFQHHLEAQAGIFPTALGELKDGEKRTHWMWFIFPQLAGLGNSPMSQRFALNSLEEADVYLRHPVLGPRLREAADAMLNHVGTHSAHAILSSPDDMKFHASVTLFARAAPKEERFQYVLAGFFGGEEHQPTVELLRR